MTVDQDELLKRLLEDSKTRGSFFLNTSNLDEIQAMRALETQGKIHIDEQDVRIDHVNQRVKAGEFVGTVVTEK